MELNSNKTNQGTIRGTIQIYRSQYEGHLGELSGTWDLWKKIRGGNSGTIEGGLDEGSFTINHNFFMGALLVNNLYTPLPHGFCSCCYCLSSEITPKAKWRGSVAAQLGGSRCFIHFTQNEMVPQCEVVKCFTCC